MNSAWYPTLPQVPAVGGTIKHVGKQDEDLGSDAASVARAAKEVAIIKLMEKKYFIALR